MTKKKIGASYNRVSDDESASKEHGSLEQQEHMGVETAKMLTHKTGIEHFIQYVLTEEEGKSGGNTDRPRYQQLWNLISTRRIDFVAAKEISRLNRSIKDFCALMDHCRANGVSVHIKGLDIDFHSPMGELIYKLLALIAEFERTLIIQRTRDGVRSGMLNNSKIHGGRVLLGFDRDLDHAGVWIPNAKELKKVDRILDLIPQYDGYKSVCDALTAEGFTNKYGTPFNSDSLKRMIVSKKYEGILEVRVAVRSSTAQGLSKKVQREKIAERPLSFGVVVDLEKLKLARAKLEEWDKKFSNKTRVRHRTNLLTGLLQHKDGSSFRGTAGTARSGEVKYYYVNDKNRVSIGAEKIEKGVLKAIECYKDDAEIQQYVAEATRQVSTHLTVLDSQINELRSKMMDLKRRENKLIDMTMERSSADAVTWLELQLKELRSDRESFENGITRLERERMAMEASQPDTKNMKSALEFVFKNFGKAEPAIQRNFMRQVLEKVVVSDKNKVEIYWRFPELERMGSQGCDSGGGGFALGKNWGERLVSCRTPHP